MVQVQGLYPVNSHAALYHTLLNNHRTRGSRGSNSTILTSGTSNKYSLRKIPALTGHVMNRLSQAQTDGNCATAGTINFPTKKLRMRVDVFPNQNTLRSIEVIAPTGIATTTHFEAGFCTSRTTAAVRRPNIRCESGSDSLGVHPF